MSTINQPCLLLAYDYTALRIIDFKQAFRLIFSEKAEVVTEFHNKFIKTLVSLSKYQL